MRTIVCTLAMTALVACVAPGAEDEDAIADAAPSGKADAAGFKLGPFSSQTFENEEGEILHAVFHEDGQLDLSRYVRDATVHVQGTYKVYTYRGRDRIRLFDADGGVLLSSDWSLTARGELELDGDTFFQPRRLPDELVDCLTMRVMDYGVFEESLTEWEYPNVSIDKEGTAYALHIGGSIFDAPDSTVTVSTRPDKLVATATTEAELTVTLHVANAAPRRGEIRYRYGAAGPMELVAHVVCR